MIHQRHLDITLLQAVTEMGQIADLWQVRLDVTAVALARLATVLSQHEGERARQFHFARDYRRFVVAHAALREILSLYLDQAPADLRFTRGPWGKPTLATLGQIRFNLSHSGEFAVVAVSMCSEVGIDIERVRNIECRDLTVRQFTMREASALQSLDGSEQLHAFFRLWTCKEAFAKATGLGVAMSFSSFDVLLERGQPATLGMAQGHANSGLQQEWKLAELDVASGYAGALVAGPVQQTVVERTPEWDKLEVGGQ